MFCLFADQTTIGRVCARDVVCVWIQMCILIIFRLTTYIRNCLQDIVFFYLSCGVYRLLD